MDDVGDIEGSETDLDITDEMDTHDDDGERLVEVIMKCNHQLKKKKNSFR